VSDFVGELEARVGSPLEKWSSLKERVQQEDLRRFSDVAEDLLDVLWCLDQYKIHSVAPRGMGRDISGAYRMKGNWFADLISLLLVNQTSSPLAPRSNIQGFSQVHQIDIAWPIRQEAPLVCVETKVMGGPPVGRTTARAATADWSNRRKELKFQATDLKLFRRQQATRIDHWDNWRQVAPPSVYFLWCARMKPGVDKLDKMTREVRALTETYLDGAGIFPYRANAHETGYEVVSVPWADRVVDLDDLVHRIANQINDLAAAGAPAADERPAWRAVDVAQLEPDTADPEEQPAS
jgi:hypothetical protein